MARPAIGDWWLRENLPGAGSVHPLVGVGSEILIRWYLVASVMGVNSQNAEMRERDTGTSVE